MGTIRTTIAGVTFNNNDGSSRQSILKGMSKGRKLRFRDAATEEYPEAISVHNVKGDQLGFLPSEVAHYVRERSITPSDIKGEIHSIDTNKNSTALGCIINIDHGDLATGAVGYESVSYSGGIDWDAVRTYVRKSANERVTADDVRAYQNQTKPNYAKPSTTSSTPYEYNTSPSRKKAGNGGKAIVAMIWVILGLVLLLKFVFK